MWRIRRGVTRYLDPILRPVAARAPGFGIITHRGRKTGRTYRSPVNVFRRGETYLFFLTYGSGVDWARNILAAGSCTLLTRGRTVELVDPVLVPDPELTPAPPVVRFIQRRLAGATEYLRMREATGFARPADPG
jgi:deazaflavin-dependent oxidoreductase (nitroreductase family)